MTIAFLTTYIFANLDPDLCDLWLMVWPTGDPLKKNQSRDVGSKDVTGLGVFGSLGV